MPTLCRGISFGGNVHNLAIFPNIARSFGLAGKEMRGLGGAFQSGVDSSEFRI